MKIKQTGSPSSVALEGVIYLDNAATSWPKPPCVAQAMTEFLETVGANPGRSGHRLSIDAARIVYETREEIALLFGASDPLRVTFGLNVTDGINYALHGLLNPGDHVITSSMEHNAVMRPLRMLETRGIELTQVACAQDGTLQAIQVEEAIKPNTKLIVLNLASNVCGTILPVKVVGQIARKHNLLFLVDTAQGAGLLPLDMKNDQIDLLAFTGHKSLYGPMGTGGLIFGERIDPSQLYPYRQGGTGSRSEKEIQPDFLPDRFESGTPNAVGLAGLLSAVRWLRKEDPQSILVREQKRCAFLLEGLRQIPNLVVYGIQEATKQTATISFNIRGMEASTVGLRLDEEYQILCRVGLHCAPAAHKTLGTFPDGSVRFGIGAFNSEDDLQRALTAVSTLAKEVQ